MENMALVIDTNHRYSDVWAPCFGRLEKFFPKSIKKYIFVDIPSEEIPSDIQSIYYDDNETYRNQFLSCLQQIEEDYILYSSEDYILYDHVQEYKLQYVVNILEENSANFMKLIKGPEYVSRYRNYPDIFEINPADGNFFAQQASVWNTKDFKKVFEASPSTNGRMQQEPGGSNICRQIGINKGLQYYSGENKRGLLHYNSSIFPYIATAVVKGKWNISEYNDELQEIFQEYNIDAGIRGYNA